MEVLEPYVDFKELEKTDENFKSALLEWSQKTNTKIQFVHKKIVKEKGHYFEVELILPNGLKFLSSAKTKKMAEQQAAEQALKALPNVK